MAYVSKERKAAVVPNIKKVLKKYGVKGTVKVEHHATLCVTLRKIPVGLFPENQTEKELKEFIDGLNSQQFAKITEFFGKLPSLEHTMEFTCISCEAEQEIELRGLSSFFT